MAEILFVIRTAGLSDDADIQAGILQIGDVVAVCEDGHEWSRLELAKSEWRIFTVPGVSVSTYAGLVMPDESVPGNAVPVRVRSHGFDRALLFGKAAQDTPTNLAEFLADDGRKVARLNVFGSWLQSAILTKAPEPADRVIG